MIDRTTDAVPEADLAEQSVPANPNDQLDDTVESPIREVPEGDSGWTADEGDLIEQSIPVPMDDDYTETADSDY
ncbi:hypothetical protein AB0N05_03960 [Nocardia sp. NPDC051030]|uniref:hypothetical protein n=1 Tax=Nocardia sp. NPDC051030 TaxID=3155162 RepID=UPI0034396EA4